MEGKSKGPADGIGLLCGRSQGWLENISVNVTSKDAKTLTVCLPGRETGSGDIQPAGNCNPGLVRLPQSGRSRRFRRSRKNNGLPQSPDRCRRKAFPEPGGLRLPSLP